MLVVDEVDDGRRVISGRGMTTAIGMKGRGQGIARIQGLKALKTLENNALPLAIGNPIQFTGGSPKVDAPSDGFEATVLQELCEALLKARDAGALQTEQEQRYGAFADMLTRSFARVGIVALVDEATGYQAVRPQDALQQYLEMLVRKELAASEAPRIEPQGTQECVPWVILQRNSAVLLMNTYVI